MILYKNFNKIDRICRKYGIEDYTINSDGSIDCYYIELNNRKLDEFPLKFRNAHRSFYCSFNNLISLEGSPRRVEGNFDCGNNKLDNLIGCPEYVDGIFSFMNNNVKSLKGIKCAKMIRYKNNPVELIFDRLEFPMTKMDRVIDVFNENDIDSDSDPEYLQQLFEDYGIIYKL